jgi:hypothetical protein
MNKQKYGLFSAFGEMLTVVGKSAYAVGRLADAGIEGAEMAVEVAVSARAGALLDKLVEANLLTADSKEALVLLSVKDPVKYELVLNRVLTKLSADAESLVAVKPVEAVPAQ